MPAAIGPRLLAIYWSSPRVSGGGHRIQSHRGDPASAAPPEPLQGALAQVAALRQEVTRDPLRHGARGHGLALDPTRFAHGAVPSMDDHLFSRRALRLPDFQVVHQHLAASNGCLALLAQGEVVLIMERGKAIGQITPDRPSRPHR